jgi:hypothetical protein
MTDPVFQTEPRDPGAEPEGESLWMRLLWIIILSLLIPIANSVLTAATVLQFILMVLNKKQPNTQVAWFGHSLGDWLAKAARFQTAASEEKPWPWSPFTDAKR